MSSLLVPDLDGHTLWKLHSDVYLVLYHTSIHIHRLQRCAGSASAAGSRLVSSHLCRPGSRESALDKACRGVSCLVSPLDRMAPRRISSSGATASHKDNDP